MNALEPIETAPKDEIILLDVGLPWLVIGCWNESADNFVWANLACGLYEGKEDPWFENEWDKPDKINGWLPLPEIKKAR